MSAELRVMDLMHAHYLASYPACLDIAAMLLSIPHSLLVLKLCKNAQQGGGLLQVWCAFELPSSIGLQHASQGTYQIKHNS